MHNWCCGNACRGGTHFPPLPLLVWWATPSQNPPRTQQRLRSTRSASSEPSQVWGMNRFLTRYRQSTRVLAFCQAFQIPTSARHAGPPRSSARTRPHGWSPLFGLRGTFPNCPSSADRATCYPALRPPRAVFVGERPRAQRSVVLLSESSSPQATAVQGPGDPFPVRLVFR